MVTVLEEIEPAYYKDLVYIDNVKKITCMQKPRRLYRALYRYYYGKISKMI